jgi:hypothetical protein
MVQEILASKNVVELRSQNIVSMDKIRQSLSIGEPKKLIRKFLIMAMDEEAIAKSSALGYNVDNTSIPTLILDAIQGILHLNGDKQISS